MALTQDELDVIVNPALDRIAAQNITVSSTSAKEYTIANRYYEDVRDQLLRSFEWNFARKRTVLYPIQTLSLDIAPQPDMWAVGDIITGISSGAESEVLEVSSGSVYIVAGDSIDFSSGETIVNATMYGVTYENSPVAWENNNTGADDNVYWYDDSDVDQVVCGSGFPTQANTSPDYEWDYQYELPSDYLRLIKVYEDDGTDGAEYRYKIEGTRILTNYDTMNINYVYRVTDPTLFSDMFSEVLILRLALKLVIPLKGAVQDAFFAGIAEELKIREAHARVVDGQENNTSGQQDYLLARYSQE